MGMIRLGGIISLGGGGGGAGDSNVPLSVAFNSCSRPIFLAHQSLPFFCLQHGRVVKGAGIHLGRPGFKSRSDN